MSDQKIQRLNSLLADYQVLYQKLRGYHWNVQGPMFFALHAKFEELYTDAATKVDEVAERVVALGGKPLSTLKSQLGAATLKEDETVPSADSMVRNLIADYGHLNTALRALSGGAAGDSATVNLADGFADAQEKTIWMLRAFVAA